MRGILNAAWRRIALCVAGGSVFFLEGCDPTIRTTVENGIITSSNAFLTSWLTAFFQVAAEGGA